MFIQRINSNNMLITKVHSFMKKSPKGLPSLPNKKAKFNC